MRISVIVFIILSSLFIACNDNKETAEMADVIEFYLLHNYELESNSCAIKESTAVIEDSPLLEYSELESYDRSNFKFKIIDSAVPKIFDHLDYSLHQKAFAVCADKEIIYTGYFWAGYSSLSCGWTVIDPINFNSKNELRLSSVYPGYIIHSNKADQYNSYKIIEVFKRDGKLIN